MIISTGINRLPVSTLFIAFLAVSAAGEIPWKIGETTYVVREGSAFEVRGSSEVFVTRLHEPGYLGKTYFKRGGKIYRRDGDGRGHPVRTLFKEGFENAREIADLIGPRRGWSAFTLQSPKARTVRHYVDLRNRILRGEGGFLDNRVEPSAARARGGAASLRCLAHPPNRRMVTSKASLETGLAYFTRNDDFWFSGHYFLAGGLPGGLMDLEATYIENAPGPRILLDEEGVPRVELKWADKPTYRMSNPAPFPRGRWVRLTVHFFLHESKGLVELWLDGRRIIQARGPTLPFPETVLDSVELGLTAAHPGAVSEVFVDDVVYSAKPLNP